MKNIILLIALLAVTFSTIQAQDIIELKSGDQMQVKITKIGLEEIEFRPYGSSDVTVIKLDKHLIKQYRFENSDAPISLYAEKLTNLQVKDLYGDKKVFAIKTQPISLISGKYRLSYEQNLSYNRSMEIELGVTRRTGLFDTFDDEFVGINSTLRYKMFYRPTSIKMTDIGRNPLHGLYVAPVVSIGSSRSVDHDSSYGPQRSPQNVFGALMMDLGYQCVVSQVIVDAFVGTGFSLNSENEDFSFNSSHFSAGKAAIRCGFRIGLNQSY